jgi:hypothetical protein
MGYTQWMQPYPQLSSTLAIPRHMLIARSELNSFVHKRRNMMQQNFLTDVPEQRTAEQTLVDDFVREYVVFADSAT